MRDVNVIAGTMREIEHQLADGDTTNAENTINNFTPTDSMGMYYRDYYSLQLKWLRGGFEVWEENDSLLLTKLATLCPYKDGGVVYNARAIYAVVNNKVEQWDDGCSGTTQSRGVTKRPAIVWAPKAGDELALAKVDEIRVYPNPTTGQVSIAIPSSLGTAWQVHVSSVDGRTIPLYGYQSMAGTLQFNLKVAPGVYFVHVVNSDSQKEVVKKLLVN